MNREIPIVNRVVFRKEQERANDLHLTRISSMKFSNISSLRGKTQAQSAVKAKQAEVRLTPLEGRQRRVKTVMNDERIREENRNLYVRLVQQKATLSSKLFAEQRYRNIQFLRRIGRYPYRQNSMVLEPLKEEGLERSHTLLPDEVESAMNNLRVSLNSVESLKHYQINSKIEEEERKLYMILLFSKVVQLQKNWHTVKFVRFKNHYQIEVAPYPHHDLDYRLKLPEEVGTHLLSENDYDYEYIASHCIKFTQQALCLSFELAAEQKKYFYKFEKKRGKAEKSPDSPEGGKKAGGNSYRRTMFALQNEEGESKPPRQSRLRGTHQSEINYNDDIVIELSRRG